MIMFGQRFRIANMEGPSGDFKEGAIGRVIMIQEFTLNGGGLKSLPPWQSNPGKPGQLPSRMRAQYTTAFRWLSGKRSLALAGQVQRRLFRQ